MENMESMPRPEIVLVADTVAREKNIDREDVFTAMEVAIQKGARSKYGMEHDIRAVIDRKTGAISLSRYREVVADDALIENEAAQIPLKLAKTYKADAKVGDFLIDQLPPIDFGRIAAQTAKQVIVQKVREAERNKQFEEYKEKIGTIINGTVKRIEFGSVILDIGKTEAVLRRDEIIPREKFKNGDRVRAYVLDVRRENKGPQIFLSRTCPEFLAKLFAAEVPPSFMSVRCRPWPVFISVISGMPPAFTATDSAMPRRAPRAWTCVPASTRKRSSSGPESAFRCLRDSASSRACPMWRVSSIPAAGSAR